MTAKRCCQVLIVSAGWMALAATSRHAEYDFEEAPAIGDRDSGETTAEERLRVVVRADERVVQEGVESDVIVRLALEGGRSLRLTLTPLDFEGPEQIIDLSDETLLTLEAATGYRFLSYCPDTGDCELTFRIDAVGDGRASVRVHAFVTVSELFARLTRGVSVLISNEPAPTTEESIEDDVVE